MPQEFILYSDHKALRFLNSLKKLNSRHGNWVKFLQPYPYVIKHKAEVENKVTDALSHHVSILVAISNEVTRFERIKNNYESCLDFGEVYKILANGLIHEQDDYFLLDGYSSRPINCLSQGRQLEILSFGKYTQTKCQATS